MHPTTRHAVYGNVKKAIIFANKDRLTLHNAQFIRARKTKLTIHLVPRSLSLWLVFRFCRSLPTRISRETYSAHLQHEIPLAKTRPMRKQRGVSLADRASRVRLSTYTFTHTPGQLRELLAWTRTRAREAYASFPRMLYSRREIFRGRSLSQTPDRGSSFAIS